jgi:thiamine pyrophosphate-dependent acetolactate synthase large subunit-like protein
MESGFTGVYAETWHGSMANAMPPAIGAQEALPDWQVVSRSG